MRKSLKGKQPPKSNEFNRVLHLWCAQVWQMSTLGWPLIKVGPGQEQSVGNGSRKRTTSSHLSLHTTRRMGYILSSIWLCLGHCCNFTAADWFNAKAASVTASNRQNVQKYLQLNSECIFLSRSEPQDACLIIRSTGASGNRSVISVFHAAVSIITPVGELPVDPSEIYHLCSTQLCSVFFCSVSLLLRFSF